MRSRLLCLLSSWCSLCFCGELHAQKVTYADHVLPILRDKCAACHNPDKNRGGFNVATYSTVMAGASSGPVIKPGEPDASKMLQVVSHKAEPFMPPKADMIPKESIEVIRQWIAGGALETGGSKPVPAKPRVEIGLKSVAKGKPEGPPPLPAVKLSLEPVIKTTRANALTALASNPWSPLIAVGGQKQVLLYHAETFDLLGVLPFPEGVPHVLKFSRNGSLLLAGGGRGGKSGRVVVWSVTTGERVVEIGDESDAVLAADISSDQTQIALGGPSKMIRIYSTKDGQLLHQIKKHTDWIYSIEYSPDGVLLATADRNGGLFVWEAHTAREYFSLRGHTAAINEVSWRDDSNALASASEDGTIRLWEMENGGNFKAWGHGAAVASVRYAHDGRLVSCGRDRVVKTWDGNGGAQRAFEAFPDVALRTTFSHDGSRVVAGDWSGQVRVHNAADGRLLSNLVANPLSVAERLEASVKEIAAKEAALGQLTAALNASQAAAQKATADLAAAQKAVADTANAAKVAADNLAKVKDNAAKAAAGLPAAQLALPAKDVVAKAYAEAAAKVQDAATKAKDNKDLAAAAAKSAELAKQAAAELAAAQKAVADVQATIKAANDQVAAAQQTATNAVNAAAAAPKAVEAQTANVKATAAKAAADKAALDQATADLAAAKARAERLKAVAVAAKTAQK